MPRLPSTLDVRQAGMIRNEDEERMGKLEDKILQEMDRLRISVAPLADSDSATMELIPAPSFMCWNEREHTLFRRGSKRGALGTLLLLCARGSWSYLHAVELPKRTT